MSFKNALAALKEDGIKKGGPRRLYSRKLAA
jgi:hypothetical protein